MKVTPILCKKGESISSIHANNHVKIARDQLVPNKRENDHVPFPLEGAFHRSDQLSRGEVICSERRRNASIQSRLQCGAGLLIRREGGGQSDGSPPAVNRHIR